MNHVTPSFITDQIKANPKRSWLRGDMDKDGWFVIKNLLSGRVLTAMKSFEKPMIAGNQDIPSSHVSNYLVYIVIRTRCFVK